MTRIPLAYARTHAFRNSLQVGLEAEAKLYRLLEGKLEKADMPLQRLGIDAIFTSLSGNRYSVEVKADVRARETGNAFIEVQSSEDKLGWALTSCAQILLYYIPDLQVPDFQDVLVIPMLSLRDKLQMLSAYPKAQAQNEGYASTGLLVPLATLRTLHVDLEDFALKRE